MLRNIFGINHERLSQKLFLEKAEAVDQLFNQIVETMAGRGSLKNTDPDSQFFFNNSLLTGSFDQVY